MSKSTQLKGKTKKGNLGKAESAGEFTSWADLLDYGVLIVGAYETEGYIDTKNGRVENPIHADVVVFDPETRKPIKAYLDNNFFRSNLALKVLNDAVDDQGYPSGSMGVVTHVDLGKNKHTYNLDEPPGKLGKAILSFYESDAVVASTHGWTIDKKVVRQINSGSF